MILVGVGGARGSGKNTFAKLCIEILEEKGYTALEMSWASLLKKQAARSLGIDLGDQFEAYNKWADEFKAIGKISVSYLDRTGSEYPDFEISGREYLQYDGTEGHREVFDDNFWVNEFWAHNKMEEWYKDSDMVVFICDTRFDNEAQSVVEHGGINIRIQRDEVEESLEDTHASEAGFDPQYLDVVIENNEGLEELQVAAETFVASILAGEELKQKVLEITEPSFEELDRKEFESRLP